MHSYTFIGLVFKKKVLYKELKSCTSIFNTFFWPFSEIFQFVLRVNWQLSVSQWVNKSVSQLHCMMVWLQSRN